MDINRGIVLTAVLSWTDEFDLYERVTSMVKFEFYLYDNDYDRLYAIKKIQGKSDLNGNEFAAELLSSLLHKLFPSIPEYDDDGRLINADKYRGPKG